MAVIDRRLSFHKIGKYFIKTLTLLYHFVIIPVSTKH